MDIPGIQNKQIVDGAQINNDSDENKGVTVTAVGPSMNEYHFPGSPDYLPMSVKAATIEQATEIWKDKRQPVEQTNANQ
jgi:hypothetical protein